MFLRSKRVGFYRGILKNLKNRKLNFIFNAPTMYFTGKLRLYGVPFSSFQSTGISWGGYSQTLPIRVCAAQRCRDFEAPDLERGIHLRGVF